MNSLFSLSADFQFSIMQYCIAMNSNQASRAIFCITTNYSNQIYFKLSHVIDFNVHSMEWQLMLITLFTMSSQINLPLLCIKASSATNVFCATREPWTFTVSANINHSSIFSWILWFFLRKSVVLQAPDILTRPVNRIVICIISGLFLCNMMQVISKTGMFGSLNHCQ